MANKKEIHFSIEKEKALKIAKKAASSKFAIMKEDGFVFKVGAPMMTATVEINDGIILVSGSGAGAPIANTVFNLIQEAIEESKEVGKSSSSGIAPTISMEDQLKAIEAIKKYKELADQGIITQEEFEMKKKELLFAQSRPSCDDQSKETRINIQSSSESITPEPSSSAGSEQQVSDNNGPTNDTLLAISRLGKIVYFSFAAIPFIVFLIGYITIFFIALNDYPIQPYTVGLGLVILGCILAYFIIVLSQKKAKIARIALNSVAVLSCAFFGIAWFTFSTNNSVFIIMNTITFGFVIVNLIISIVKK